MIRTELDVTLADDEADEAELRRMGGVVRDATERAGQLVNSLLLLARTDGAGLGVREPVDLAAVVDRAWRATRLEAEQRGIRASFTMAPAPAFGDPALLERIAGNLLENAVRHNVEGGWLDVLTQPGPQWSTLRVRSSGGLVDPAAVAGAVRAVPPGGRGPHGPLGRGPRAVDRPRGGPGPRRHRVGGADRRRRPRGDGAPAGALNGITRDCAGITVMPG